MHNNLIEKNLSQYFQDFYITRSSSGTSALIAILKSLTKDSNKDEVIIPSVVCPSVMFAVNFLCLKPVFVDMELKFFNMCIKDLKKKISKKTLAIIGVHCFGIAADINSLVTICKKKKIFLIEDACLNFGGKLNKKYYGAFGDASIVSFGYDKILSEKGGALMIKNKKKFLFIKNFFKKNPEFFEFKFNKKSFQDKFNKLEENIENRKKNAKIFFLQLASKNIIKPKFRKEDVYWRYPIIYKNNRERLINKANQKGIIMTKHYSAINKFQSNSILKVANIMDKSILNFFVKPGTDVKYINNICSLFKNEK